MMMMMMMWICLVAASRKEKVEIVEDLQENAGVEFSPDTSDRLLLDAPLAWSQMDREGRRIPRLMTTQATLLSWASK